MNVMYTKTAGKGGCHADVDMIDCVTQLSGIGVQVFEHYRDGLFTSLFRTVKQNGLSTTTWDYLRSYGVLWHIPAAMVSPQGQYTRVAGDSLDMFGIMDREIKTLNIVTKALKGRSKEVDESMGDS